MDNGIDHPRSVGRSIDHTTRTRITKRKTCICHSLLEYPLRGDRIRPRATCNQVCEYQFTLIQVLEKCYLEGRQDYRSEITIETESDGTVFLKKPRSLSGGQTQRSIEYSM